jgi:multiple sugar transport system substrate-binding protein
VIKQSKNPALAAGFVRWLNHDPQSISIFLGAGGGFPSTTSQLGSDEFLSAEPEYFGGQKINEVLAAAADSVVPGWQ